MGIHFWLSSMKKDYYSLLGAAYLSITILGVVSGILALLLKGEAIATFDGAFHKIEEKQTPFDFSFLPLQSTFPFPDIDKTILPLAVNTRPDAPKHPDILVKVGSEEVVIPGRELVYLSFQKGVSLSPTPTSLSLKNEIAEDGSIQMEVGVHFLSNEKKSAFRFEDLKRDVTIAAAMLFKESDVLGPDCLFDLYGGREYQKKKGKMRLKFHDGHLLFIGKEDLLSFKEGKWFHGSDKESPLAKILSITPFEIELKVWDVSGLQSELVKLSLLKTTTSTQQPNALFTKLRRKTATKVTCRMGQKNVLLKKGDWLIRTKSGWREIKTAKELSDCLTYKLQGDLFICDGIEKNQFTGTFFDESRMTTQKIRLPFGEGKKK